MKKCNAIFILFLFPTTSLCAAAHSPHFLQHKLHEAILSANLDMITHSLNAGAQISETTVHLFNTVYNNTQEKLFAIANHKEIIDRLSHDERIMHLNSLKNSLKTLTEMRTILVAQQAEQQRLAGQPLKRLRLR